MLSSIGNPNFILGELAFSETFPIFYCLYSFPTIYVNLHSGTSGTFSEYCIASCSLPTIVNHRPHVCCYDGLYWTVISTGHSPALCRAAAVRGSSRYHSLPLLPWAALGQGRCTYHVSRPGAALWSNQSHPAKMRGIFGLHCLKTFQTITPVKRQ